MKEFGFVSEVQNMQHLSYCQSKKYINEGICFRERRKMEKQTAAPAKGAAVIFCSDRQMP